MKAASLGLLPLLALTALFVGQRENVIFTGRVTDAVSGLPIDGARVTVTTMGSTRTDDDGRFRLTIHGQTLANRVVEIRVEHLAYQSAVTTATITGETVEIDFTLTAGLDSRGREEDEPKSSDRPQNEQAAVERPRQAVVGVLMKRAGAALNSFVAADALSTGSLPGRFDPDFNTESYDHLDENPFLAVGANPRSTFSIDVDRASYSNMRRFIESGHRPPRDAVRIEELVNYFSYDYPDPTGEHPFAVVTEVSDAPWNPAHRLVRIGIQGERVDTADLPPTNLVFLIDVSGSMQSANKLPLLKSSFRLLVNQLRSEDRVAIAVYAGAAGLVLPSTPGSEKDKILAAIDQLEAGGSTAGGAGIRLAYSVAQENHLNEGNNRVILATDGDFNVGASSDGEMVRLIEEKREQGTFLTVLGFGTGNVKDSKMEKLADHGNGNFAYIDTIDEAKKVLITEMGGTLLTIAKDVKIQVEFNPERVQAHRLIGYENRMLRTEDFNDDKKDAGELGAGHTVTALYEIVPAGIESDVEIAGVDSLRYQAPSRSNTTAASSELLFVKLRYKQPTGVRSILLQHAVEDEVTMQSTDFTFATAVAGFGMLLRDSDHINGMSLDAVIELARESLGDDAEGYRAEFLRLARRVQEMEMLEVATP